jgi:hypothetical protein
VFDPGNSLILYHRQYFIFSEDFSLSRIWGFRKEDSKLRDIDSLITIRFENLTTSLLSVYQKGPLSLHFPAGPLIVAKAKRPDNHCLDWQCGGWVTAAGVVENFFHQQNWREHKERN